MLNGFNNTANDFILKSSTHNVSLLSKQRIITILENKMVLPFIVVRTTHLFLFDEDTVPIHRV